MFQSMANSRCFNLYYYPTSKFKTATIRVFFKKDLVDAVEETAILPFILKRGCRNFPSLQHLSRRLEELYGAALSLDVAKMGEAQIFVASLDVVNPRYLPDSKGLLLNCIDLLNDVILNPVLEDGAFPKDRFEQERTNLARFVRSIIDDKISYAHIRLVQEMFRGEPFGNYEWGALDKIETIDRIGAYGAFQRLCREAPIDVYVLGQLAESEENALPGLLLPFSERGTSTPIVNSRNTLDGGGDVVVEEQPLEQSKVEMGFRVDMDCSDEDFYAIVLYNAVLGRGSFSKLFKKVREEAGMAYYTSSSFDKLKGFLYVSAGIDTANFQVVTDRIRACMDEIAAGDITDEELRNAKSSLINGLRSIADNPGQIIEYDLAARTAGREKNIDRIIGNLEKVTKEQVSRVSRLIVPGKTFFLKGTGNSHESNHNPE